VGASIFLSVYYVWSKEKCSEGTLTASYPLTLEELHREAKTLDLKALCLNSLSDFGTL